MWITFLNLDIRTGNQRFFSVQIQIFLIYKPWKCCFKHREYHRFECFSLCHLVPGLKCLISLLNKFISFKLSNSISNENPDIIIFRLLLTIFTIWNLIRKYNIKPAWHNVWVHILKVCYWNCWILASFISNDGHSLYIYCYLFWIASIHH